MKIAIIGGGAGGFYSAIHVKNNYPQASVVIFEKSKKVLSKVKVSGGGRCNVTNACSSISQLSKGYPRGGKQLKKLFSLHSNIDTMRWFESQKVKLTTQEDLHVFPETQSSQTIIDCFINTCKKKNIRIQTQANIIRLDPVGENVHLYIKGEKEFLSFDKCIIATGGSPKRSGLLWLEKLDLKIEDPVPSLFTFNMPDENITQLMGIVVENATASIQGTKLKHKGPLLITHWGMSGPSIIVLSSFGARILHDKSYSFNIQVNWVSEKNDSIVYEVLNNITQEHPKKQLVNFRPYLLPERLWRYLLDKLNIEKTRLWSEIGKKGLNKLTTILTNDVYVVKGKTTFKEEFVTCGGVSLESINMKTMASYNHPNLYFAGEVLNIDGITGGYNFQAAWTTAFVAAQLK